MKKPIAERYTYWDWKLFLSILLYLSIPPIYQSYSLYLIGNTPPRDNNLAIVSQWQFVQVALEVIQEALVFPLFFYIGSQWQERREALFQRARDVFFYLLVFLAPAILLLYFGMGAFVERINTTEALRMATTGFLRIKLGALLLGIINAGLIIMVESLRKKRILLYLLFLKLLLSVVFDSWFFGGYSFSLSLGVKGVALSNLLTEFLIFLVSAVYFYRLLGAPLKQYFRLPALSDFHLFRNISQWIALESLIRNVAYFFMILQLMNALGPKQIGGYYLAMHLFWSFALLPFSALAETMKALIANSSDKRMAVKKILGNGLLLGIGALLLWLAALPALKNMIALFTNDPEIAAFAGNAILFLFFPYVLLAFNLLLDTLFIGLGQTKYLAYQSILTNLGVYGAAFILYQFQLWTPTFTSILLLFGMGILVDSVLTVWYARMLLTSPSQA